MESPKREGKVWKEFSKKDQELIVQAIEVTRDKGNEEWLQRTGLKK